MPRGLKKFLYGLLYLAAAGLLVFWWYRAAVAPVPSCFDGVRNGGETGIDCGGPCEPCEVKNLLPLRAERVRTFRTDGGDVAAVAALVNPNEAYEGDVSYTVSFRDEENKEIGSVARTATVPPGGVWYAYEAYRERGRSVAGADVQLTETTWRKRTDALRPAVSVRDVRVETADGRVVVRGAAVNGGLARAENVDVIAVVSDRNGFPLFASKTLVEALPSGGEREFSILFPVNETLVDRVSADAPELYVNVP